MSVTLRSFRSLVSGLLLLALGAGAQAGQVRAELAGKLAALQSDDPVKVIIRCVDKVDRRQFTDADISQRRQRLLAALRDKADRCLATVDAVLRNRATDVTVLRTISGVAATVPASLVDTLARLPGVESVTLDAVVLKPAGSTSSSSTPEWNLQAIRAPELWALGHDGSGVVVALMDTGVDAYHPDIGPKWRGGTNSWFDPNGQHATPYDADGHGTWATGLLVGGSAGGTAIGVAPGARWIGVKIFDDSGQSLLSRIHLGFQWLLDPDSNPATDDAPDIVNNSWYLQGTINSCNTEFADDVALLRTSEIAVVFAGGNTGPSPETSVSPSNDPQALAVGAVGASLAAGDFSGRGASACDGSYYPGVAAPGVAVRTADLTFGGIFPNSYRSVTGTSFAAPHVAGGLALLRGAMAAQGIPVTVSLLEAAVAQTATDLGTAGPDDTYGAGLLDVVNAYNWLLANAGGTPQPGQLRFSASAYTVAENGGSIVLTVTRVSGSAGTVTVNHATTNGSASAGSDFVATSGTLTFLDGETSKTFAVTITDDAVYEGNETFSVALSSPTGGATLGSPATAQVTITENDAQPQPGQLLFSAASYSVNENGGTATITVQRSGGSDGTVTVNYATSNGTATAGADYAAASGTLSFGPGVVSRTFTVTIIDDTVYEGNETVNLTLSGVTGGATLGTPASAVLTIADNGPPVITSTPVTTATVGQAYGYDVNATDPNAGQTLTYSLTTFPTGMTINASSGLIAWTPTAGQAGPNSVTVQVTDNGTPPLSTTQTFTVTVSGVPDAIFADGFESGNLSAWTSVQDGEADLSVTAAAAMAGSTNGLTALIDNNTAMWVQSDTPTAETRYRARFYYDPNSVVMVNGNSHWIMTTRSGNGTAGVDVVRIELRRNSGNYQLRASVRTDGGGYTNTAWFTIADSPHAIEIDWQAATAAGANNGSLRLWIDNGNAATPTATLSGIDNDTLSVEAVRLGPLQGIDTGTRGTVYFDGFVSRRTTFIGP